MMEWMVIIGYGLAMLVVCIFSLEQLYLAIIYQKSSKAKPAKTLTHFPRVTVQLPIYNEKYVAERLLDCICSLDYPLHLLEIQVLDDSTDETVSIIARKVDEWTERGIHIQHIRRPNRTGYKAGALQYGLEKAQGEFIAIFDADFLPDKDFLLKTLPHFTEQTGMVQTRWDHLNHDYSLLTRMQAFGLNAHFTVEQTGRLQSRRFINFNGTAGVWRKSCIYDAGGWQSDTLTEDLDLSYRAQLAGWQFEYLEGVTSPAELPVLVTAIKSQQYRWNKGAAETARKTLPKLLKSNQPFGVKLHGTLHLLNSSVFLFLILASLLSIPMLFVQDNEPVFKLIFDLASLFFIGFMGMTVFYWISSRAAIKDFSWKYYLTHFPLFLIFSMGLALHNAIAVAEGYMGIKTPFIRTPKFNIQSKSDRWQGNTYLRQSLSPLTFLEGIFALYFLFGVLAAVYLWNFGLIAFHLMLTAGFGSVFFLSVKPIPHAGAQ